MSKECVGKPCIICRRIIQSGNYHCPRCNACICLYCGAEILKDVELDYLKCPRCYSRLKWSVMFFSNHLSNSVTFKFACWSIRLVWSLMDQWVTRWVCLNLNLTLKGDISLTSCLFFVESMFCYWMVRILFFFLHKCIILIFKLCIIG